MSDEQLITIKNKIMLIPEQIRTQEVIVLDINETIDRIREQKKEIRRETFGVVCNETIMEEVKEQSYKTKPKYTNAESREAETDRRLSANTEFRVLLSEEGVCERNKGLAIIERDYLKNELKSIDLLLRLLEARI